MRKLFTVLSCLIIASMLASCTSNDRNNDNSPQEEVALVKSEDEMKGTISISKYGDFNVKAFYTQVNAFKNKHPNVEVIVNEYPEDGVKYVETIRTQLMSGSADDIIDGVFVDYNTFSEKGYLVNFYDLMEKDKSFKKEDYYQNVFEAFTYKNGLYVFPTSFYYTLIAINEKLSSQQLESFRVHDKINYSDILNIYANSPEPGKYMVFPFFSLFNLIYHDISTYINFEEGTCNFNTPEFIQLLTNWRQYSDHQFDWFWGYWQRPMDLPADQSDFGEKYAFLEIRSNNAQYFLPYESNNFKDFIPVVHGNGKIDVVPENTFLINRKSQNKELAWEFIKFLTSEEANADYFPEILPIPVKKDVFRTMYEKHSKRQIDALTANGVYFDEEYLEDNYGKAISVAIDKISAMNEMPMEYSNWNDIQDIFGSEELLVPFITEVATAEETAANIQSKVSLALNE